MVRFVPRTAERPRAGSVVTRTGRYPASVSTGPTPPLPRFARAAARAAVRAVRTTGPLTGPLVTVAEPDAEHVRRVLDLTLRVAESMLGSGASANDTTDAALRLTRAYGVRGVHVDVTYTSISISVHHGPHRDPITVLRVVRARATDFTRIQGLDAIVTGAENGLTVEVAREQYDRVMRQPMPYRRWVITAANGLLAAGVCLLFASSLVIAVVATVASALIDVLLGALARRRVPPFFAQMAGAAIPTTAAVLVMVGIRAGVPVLADVRPSLIVASGIVLMLSGLSMVGAAQDAIDGFFVTAGARAFEVMMMTLGIVVGIVATLQCAARAGVDMSMSTAAPTLGPLPMQLAGAFVIASTFAVATGAGPRALVVCSAMGVLSWAGYAAAGTIGFGDISASGLGAIVGGFVSTLVATRMKVPSIAFATAAVVPLMPGSMIFRSLLVLVAPDAGDAQLAQGAVGLLAAVGVGIALAAGVSLGTYAARPMARTRTRERRPAPTS